MLRKHGPEIVDGKEIAVAGTGAWKTFSVTDTETGEILIEKKFHKPKFNEIMKSPEYSHYIDSLLEVVMVKKFAGDPDIDTESYEEMRSLSLEVGEEIIDPED